MKPRPLMPMEGDYSGRGTWANQTRYCDHRDSFFRGKRVQVPVPCLNPARPGHRTCESHQQEEQR